jgi:hypothetical protein
MAVDGASPIVGYRAWRLGGRIGTDSNYLLSVGNDEGWTFEPTEAHCKRIRLPSHQAPVEGCACGYWAVSSVKELESVLTAYSDAAVLGIVIGWGRINGHARGFRSQFMRPVVLAACAGGEAALAAGEVSPPALKKAVREVAALYHVDRVLSPEAYGELSPSVVGHVLEQMAGEYGETLAEKRARHYVAPCPEDCHCPPCGVKRQRYLIDTLKLAVDVLGDVRDLIAEMPAFPSSNRPPDVTTTSGTTNTIPAAPAPIGAYAVRRLCDLERPMGGGSPCLIVMGETEAPVTLDKTTTRAHYLWADPSGQMRPPERVYLPTSPFIEVFNRSQCDLTLIIDTRTTHFWVRVNFPIP